MGERAEGDEEADEENRSDETWPDENERHENDWAEGRAYYEGRESEAQREDRE